VSRIQVFVSYAHTPADSALATCVAASLRSVGIDVWLDEATLSGGDLLQDAIEKAIAASHHGLFIVSQSWLNREWTQFELELFARRDPNIVRRIPIFRAPRRDLVIPPALIRVTGFEWFDDDRNVDARLWEAYCAVTDTPPGSRDDWAGCWRGLAKQGAAAPRPITASCDARQRPSLCCDRAVQWNAVEQICLERAGHVMLLPGCMGQAHDHFVERIQRLLRLDPPRSMVTIDWPTRPRRQDEFLEALARALGVAPEAVAGELGERLAYNNLLLLHPCIRARFVDQPLVQYYTEWLPELVGRAHGDMHVRCVQPVEWPREPGGVAQVLSWLGLKERPAETEGRAEAEALIEKVKDGAPPTLRAIRLRDLADLTQDDLVEFCELVRLTQAQRAWLLARVASRRASDPCDIFQALDDFLPDARSIA
jgi:hypothetical protein